MQFSIDRTITEESYPEIINNILYKCSKFIEKFQSQNISIILFENIQVVLDEIKVELNKIKDI